MHKDFSLQFLTPEGLKRTKKNQIVWKKKRKPSLYSNICPSGLRKYKNDISKKIQETSDFFLLNLDAILAIYV